MYKALIIISIIIASLMFYWSEIRPVTIKKDCNVFAESKVNGYNIFDKLAEQGLASENKIDPTEYFYKKCLRENGLI